jgi:hypothetical protein
MTNGNGIARFLVPTDAFGFVRSIHHPRQPDPCDLSPRYESHREKDIR